MNWVEIRSGAGLERILNVQDSIFVFGFFVSSSSDSLPLCHP